MPLAAEPRPGLLLLLPNAGTGSIYARVQRTAALLDSTNLPTNHPPRNTACLRCRGPSVRDWRLGHEPHHRRAFRMATKKPAGVPSPTKYYFAYGSNLHVTQMKRRCPNSRYIGRARLANYRWQINERGFANVVEAPGHRVDGLVYEIVDRDEAKLDVNEGVSKKAYEKRHLPVLLHRAPSALYRRPVSWIIDKGGPAAVCRRLKAASPPPRQHRERNVLVYISLSHVQDSAPRDKYVDRLNLGIVDARALGVDDDYIRTCIRPFIPEPRDDAPHDASSRETTPKPAPSRGVKRSSPSRTALVPVTPKASAGSAPTRGRGKTSASPSPQRLPPRPVRRFFDVPVITVEEYDISVSAWEWRSSI